MGKSSSGRDRTSSEVSSRSERRRADDQDPSARRSGADSMTSSSRRKSSRRDGYDDDAASFAPTITEEPSEIPDRRRNESRKENSYDDTRRRSSRNDKNGKDDSRRGDVSGAAREDRRRDSHRSSKSGKREKESTRTSGDHDASLPQNQFPGEIPDTYTRPYRPPGLASEYYGDQGESVQFQPGVRPNQPSIVTNAEQAHLMEPTIEAKPPAEPSSLGQVGAAAGYFGSTKDDSDAGHQATPSKPPRATSGSSKAPKHSVYGVSPRSSPGQQADLLAFGQTPAGSSRAGAAAEYYTGGSGGGWTSAYQTPNRPPPGANTGSVPYSAPAGIGGSQNHSNAGMYAGAAALTGAAAGAYISSHAHEQHSHTEHQTSTQVGAYPSGHHQQGTQMHQAHRHEHKGLFGRFVDWWRDPAAIAQYEQYTEAIGVCKYCFDPMSTPAEAPRRHNYRRRRPSSGSRYGSTTRVDKTYRYSSDEERRKRSSTTKKVVLGGLAGYGLSKVGESVYNQHHDFDDGYSAKSGRPTNQSRVSFQDEPQHERYGDVRLQRRNSDRKSSGADKASHKDKHHRRRSSSPSSNSPSHGISRGTVMSTGAAAAGLAVAAAALDKKPRRSSRSRSRSPTSKRKYFSKRVSPMHSYVDLSTTNDGPGGLMGFFTSPSANAKKGKKPKGLFNFANDSSSSSDADLRFGEGTVRRKASSKRLRARPARPGDDHSTAAMMGLVAAGTALAAEADRRHENGKRRHDTNEYAGRNGRHTSGHRISMDDHETGGRDDEWYDTDGDAESDGSVDTALAYGGDISAAQSKESLAQNRKSSRPSSYNFREADQRRYHDRLGQPQYPAPFPVSGPQTGEAAMGGWMTPNAIAQDAQLPPGPLPPMRDIEPRPISDPPSKVVSPQVMRISSTSVPLQQPQPVLPFSPFVEGIGAEPLDTGRPPRREARQSSGERRRPRRDSSPAKLPTQDPRGSVNIRLTDEQPEIEGRTTDKDRRRKDNTSDTDRRQPTDAPGPGNSSRDEVKSRGRRSSEATRRSSDADQRVVDIERELEKLYEEHRLAEERKRKRDSGIKKVAEGAAIGAATAVVTTALAGKDSKTGSGDDSTPKRKSSLKKSRERDTSPQSETQQERIARMAAQRVRSTPSPVQHDDYSSFFVPAELREHLKEHNDQSEHREDIGATVVEIIPGAPKPRVSHPFDPYTYRQFGLELDDDPDLYPWPVPMLGLVEPTPPGSQAHSVRGNETPVIEPKDTEPLEEIGEPLERRESKVTWGDPDTYVYEVQTPEYERSSYVPDMEVREPKLTDKPSAEILDEPSPLAEDTPPRPGVGRTWTLDETEADKLEKEIPVVDDRPQVSRAWTVDDKEADQIEHRVPAASPNGETRQPETLPQSVEVKSGARDAPTSSIVSDPEELSKVRSPLGQDPSGRTHSHYQSPFAESVSDLGITGDFYSPARPEVERPATIGEEEAYTTHEQRLIEDGAFEPEVPETSPGPRMSKSERRRRERASSSVDSIPPSELERRSSEPERDSSTPPPIPGNDSVFDYLVNNKGEAVPSPSILGLGASAILAADQLTKGSDRHEHSGSREVNETDPPSKPKRSNTYDDAKSRRSRSDSRAEYQSDPEDWERSHDRKSKKSMSSSKSDIGTKTSSKSKPSREVDEATFVPLPRSSTADDLDEVKSSRRSSRHGSKDIDEDSTITRRSRDDEKKPRSKRSKDTDDYRDDDARSIADSTADSKGKKKESGGFFSNIFSSSKSDVSTSSRKSSKSSKSESRADRSEPRKKRKSRDKSDFDDVASAASEPTRRSRRSSDTPEKAPDSRGVSRDQSLDDGFVSAEETTESPVKDVKHGESFLGNRPEMPQPTVIDIPMGTDGVSGPLAERESPAQPDVVASTPVKAPVSAPDEGLEAPISPLADHASIGPLVSNSARTIEQGAGDLEMVSSPALPQVVESRRLSAIRTSDVPSSPISTGSPTAVPLLFRRPPMSPTNPRFSMSSPGAAPTSPLTTPRTRQGRPKSTEFRNSKEFRPLYLVERRNFAKTTAPEIEEDLPSLPSSRTSSSHPSMEDLRAESQAQEQAEYFPPSRMSAEMFRERGRRHSHSYWHDNQKRRESPDYLDSRSATPVPGEAQRARDQETKSKPKYEFHSPSELLQDPALFHEVPPVDDENAPQSPLPSVASTDFDQDYMSARSRSLSPTRARSFSRGRRSASTTRSTSASWHDAFTTVAAGALAGSALGIAAHEMWKDPADGDLPEELATSGKAELFREDTVAPKEAFGSAVLSQDRDIPLPVPLDEHPNSQESATLQPVVESQNAPEAIRDTGAWMNVFAEIHKRKRGPTPVADSPPAVASEQAESENLAQDHALSASLPASSDVVPVSEVAEDSSAVADKSLDPFEQEDATSIKVEPDTQRQVEDIGEQLPESSSRSKKSKKEMKAEKKKKNKKQSTLTLDDIPSKPEDSAVPDEANPKLQDQLPSTMPATTEDEAPGVETNAENDIEVQPSQDVPETPLPGSFDDGQKASIELGNQIPHLDEKVTEPQVALPAEIKSQMSPLEQAFEAAFRARGLTEGATVEAAFQSFQPEIPDIGGTQLTTIQEEIEVATPQSEQDPASTAIDAFVGRKASKKEKRKQKKSKQVLSDDWAEPSPVLAGIGDKLKPEVDTPEGIADIDRSLPEANILAEPTPAEERPNPFGNDFEIEPTGMDLPPTTIGGDGVLDTPAQEDSWGEATAAKHAETDRDVAEPDIQVVPSDTLAEPSKPPQTEETLEESKFTTPTETPQQESEDPWEMGSKPGKKKKSKSKKKSLPVNFEDIPTPELGETFAMATPTSEPEKDADRSLESDKPRNAISTEQLVGEPYVDDLPTSVRELPLPVPAAESHGLVESQLAASVIPEERQPLSPQPVEESAEARGVDLGIAAGVAVAAALLATDHSGGERSQSVVEKTEIPNVIAAASDTEDTPLGVAKVNDAGTKGEVVLSAPELPGIKDDDIIEVPKEGFSTDAFVPGATVAQEPIQIDREPVDGAISAPTPTETSADVQTPAQESLSQQDEDFYPIKRKQSKKEKKKKRTATLDEVATSSKDPSLAAEDVQNSESTLITEEKREIEVPATSVLAEEQIPIPPTQAEDPLLSETPVEDIAITATLAEEAPPFEQDDFVSVPAKKSKKEKKKKRQSTLTEPEIPTSTESTPEVDDQTAKTVPEQAAELADDPALSNTPASELAAEAPAEDVPQQQDQGFFPVSVKKSKKEKKKKRASTLILDEPDTHSPAEEAEAPCETIITGDILDKDVPPSADVGVPQPEPSASIPTDEIPPQDQDEFASTKKSKKSKKEKKKRRTVPGDFDETPEAEPVDQDGEITPITVPEQVSGPHAPIEGSGQSGENRELPAVLDGGGELVSETPTNTETSVEPVRDAIASDAAIHTNVTTSDTALHTDFIPETSTRELTATEEPQAMDLPVETYAHEYPLDKALAVEAPLTEVSVPEPGLVDSSGAQGIVSDDVTVETATVEPSAVDAPVIQSPVDAPVIQSPLDAPVTQSPVEEAAILDTHLNEAPDSETHADRPVAKDLHADFPPAVEIPVVEPATVQASTVETPADEVDVPKAPATESNTHKEYTGALATVETSIVEPLPVEREAFEGPIIDRSDNAQIAPDISAVEIPSVETPLVETPDVETPAIEDVPENSSRFEPPAEDDWGFPVKKSKKDKKKKRQPAVATEPFDSEPQTTDVEQPTEVAGVLAPEGVTTTTVAEAIPLEGDTWKTDVAAQEDAQGKLGLTSKSKNDKKKKKRQSTLAEREVSEGARDVAKESEQESQPLETEPLNTHLGTVTDEPAAVVEENIEQQNTSATELGVFELRESDQTVPEEGWASTSAKSKKDKKKKQKRQSTFADNMNGTDPAAEDATVSVADSTASKFEPKEKSETPKDEPVPTVDEQTEAQATTTQNNDATVDESVSQDAPEDDWAFTSAKPKKDKKKKKRQSMMESAPVEPKTDESVEVHPPAETAVGPLLADGPAATMPVEERDGGTMPIVSDEQAEAAWAPVVEKKEKKKRGKSKLDQDTILASEEQSIGRDVAMEGLEGLEPAEQMNTEMIADPVEVDAVPVEADQHHGPSLEAEQTANERLITAPTSTHHSEEPTLQAPPALSLNDAEGLQGEPILEIQAEDSHVGEEQLPLTLPTSEAQHMPEETAPAELAGEQELTVSDTKDVALEGQTLDYFSLSKKKSKKDKKKMRPAAFDEPETTDAFETPMEEIASTATSDVIPIATDGVEPIVDEWATSRTTKSKQGKKKQRKSMLEDSEPIEAPETPLEQEEPFQTPTEHAEPIADENLATTRKSGSKKGKKRQSTFDESLVEPASVTPEVEAAQNEDLGERARDISSGNEVSEVAAKVDDDEWNSPKKSKKEKKKKRQSTFDETFTETAAAPPKLETIAVAGEKEPALEQGISEVQQEPTVGPESIERIPSPVQPEDDNLNFSKKSKKDKKKNRRPIFTDIAVDPGIAAQGEAPRASSQTADMTTEPGGSKETEHIALEPSTDVIVVPEDVQPASDIERQVEAASVEVSDVPAIKESTTQDIPVTSSAEFTDGKLTDLELVDEPVMPAQGSTVQDETIPTIMPVEEPPAISQQPTIADHIDAGSTTKEVDLQPAHIASTFDIPAIVERDESHVQEETQLEAPTTISGEHLENAWPTSSDLPTLPESDKPQPDGHQQESQREVSDEQPEVPIQDDLWVSKPKKSKKKKRQSTFDETEFSSSQTKTAEPESSLILPQPVSTDISAEPPILDPSDQPTVEPSTEPAIEDARAMPSKKSKKNKKNRQSTFDEGAPDTPKPEGTEPAVEEEVAKPELVFDTPMPDAADEPSLDAQVTERVADEEWATPTKTKKDKKKKRRTLVVEDETQPSTPAEEEPLEDANMAEYQPDAEVTTKSLEQLEPSPAPEVNSTAEQPAAASSLPDDHSLETESFNMEGLTKATPPQSDPSVAVDEWTFSTNKAKKDKKKKKKSLALGDIEMDDSRPAIPTEQLPATGSVPELARDSAAKSIDDPVLKPESMEGGPDIVAAEPFDMQPTIIERMAQAPEATMKEVEESSTPSPPAEVMDMAPPPSIPGLHSDPIHSDELEPISSEAAIEGARELVPTIEGPAIVQSDWPEVKKSKKEKRNSKRQSTFDNGLDLHGSGPKSMELPQVDEVANTPHADVKADDQQPITQVAPGEGPDEDEWAFSTKKSKKKPKKGKALAPSDGLATPGTETPVSTDQFESATQTPYERFASPEPMEDVSFTETPSAQPEAVAEEFVTPPTSKKKSKKDKKRKSLLAWGDDVSAEDTSMPATPAPFLEPESGRELGNIAEAYVAPVAAQPKDVLGSSKQFTMDEAMAPRDNIEMASVVGEPDATRGRWPMETPRQEDDLAVGLRSSGDLDMHDEQIASTRSHPEVLPEESVPVTVGAPRSAQTLSAESAASETTRDAEEEIPTHKKSKKDKKARKERRGFEFDGTEQVEPPVIDSEETDTRELDVMETIPEETLGPSPATAPAKAASLPGEFEDLSDVSESTRERRRRRRSPPAWSGEEPADFPRDRALTPPPEHADIMDTALGIAAGLGFGGREPESSREHSPKPTSSSRQPSTGWSFAKLAPGVSVAPEPNRDSGVQFESPIFATDQFASTRDSGFIPSPATAQGEFNDSRESSVEMKLRPPRPQSPTSSTEDVSRPPASRARHGEPPALETPKRKPSPVESTSKDRSSVLFNSSPAVLSPLITSGLSRSPEPSKSPLQRSPSIHGHHHSREALRQQKASVAHHHEESEHLASNLIDRSAAAPVNRSAFEPETHNRPYTPGKSALSAIREDSREISPVAHPFSEPPVSITPQLHADKSGIGAAALVAGAGIAAAVVASRDVGAKSLGRSKSRTSSLRNLRGSSTSPFDPANFASGPSQEPVNARDTGKAAVRDRDMADVYDGYGSYPGSPKSPTRPQSVRRRQSMQQIKDLETRLDQLANENRALMEAKIVTEQHLEQAHFEQNRSENATVAFGAQLQERDAEIARLKQEVASLVATHASLKQEHEQRLFDIQREHDQAQSEWQDSSKELETLRSRHNELSTGMESIVRHEIDSRLAEKNAEIQQLRADLEIAREQVRELQLQILERPADEVVVFHDEDYFDQACQKLCQQVQGWVLRFSKFSDLKLCRSTNEVRDEKIVDRFDNAILDGSDVDHYLADRVKRRDAFMSVVMTMIWEYVFTRYLFGMDRDQRQKLKQLEKNLGEVGPASAVHQWRALTLTLLSKRESFKAQRESDTEAVALEIFSTLSRFLPPPQNLEEQIVGSLRNVMRTAVDLSIEMRTQRAEYIMLPPLQPEYDTNGDLARKVYFNASLMNERSGETTNNEDLEHEQAVVRMVLFPLVVKKGDDNGVGDDEIVVCPAQVLIARPDKAKKPRSSTRHASGGSDAKSLRAISTHSLAMSGIERNENMF